LKHKTEIVREEESLIVCHPNEGLPRGRGDWPKRAILFGYRRGGGLLKVWVAMPPHGLVSS